jgi:hypothetical protein
VRNTTGMSFQFPNFMQYARPFVGVVIESGVVEIAHDSIAEGPALWRELFLSVHSKDDLANWKAKIPKYGCSCSDFYAEHEKANPPRFPLTFKWKYSLKSAVNAKLGHENLSLAAARKFWRSQKKG